MVGGGGGRVRGEREAVEGSDNGAEVCDGGERHVLVFELLRHGADNGAEVEVLLIAGVAEFGEN